jgi:UDP-N-acetylmuramoyl-L-alanyl-D-glutamate--2,6-diaminopimelate ligase
MLSLRSLAAHVPGARFQGPDVTVTGIAYDSRRIRAGELFVAVPGLRWDGHFFIPQALERGAAAVAVQADHPQWVEGLREDGVPTLVVEDARAALSRLAAAFHGFPAMRLTVIGVTGTDGKTSLVHLIAHLLRYDGHQVGLMGTAGMDVGLGLEGWEGRTTPEAPELQAALAAMVAHGCRYAVVECTSHGLALRRVEDAYFDVAVMTHLGEDHLDFHGSWEAYRAAKGRLFSLLDEAPSKGVGKWAILNADDPSWSYFRSLTQAEVLTYGLGPGAQVRALDVRPRGWGVAFHLRTPWGETEVEVAVPGEAGVMGALAGTATALAMGLPLPVVAQGLASWRGAPGRLELVDEGQPFPVVVDYAHAPQALARLLALARQSARGRVVLVFGCIGGRDRHRRRPMGRIAGQMADYVIVTDDNPYDEERESIFQEIVAGLQEAGREEGRDYLVVPDRRQAIAHALSMAGEGDVVVLAGKGHETHVYAGSSSYPCDDREVARAFLRRMKGV